MRKRRRIQVTSNTAGGYRTFGIETGIGNGGYR